MPDISQPGATPGAAGGATPPATGDAGRLISQGPNDPANPLPANGGTGTGEEGNEDPDALRRQRNRDEALARMARERDEARQALEEERRKGLPPEELTRLKAQDEAAKAAESRIRKLTLNYEVASRSARLGIIDPELAVLLLDGRDTVSIDEAGKVSGLDEALKELIKERPYLVRPAAQPVDAGAGTGGRPATGSKQNMNDIIRGAARGRTG